MNEAQRHCGECIACCAYMPIDKEPVRKRLLEPCSRLCMSEPVAKCVVQLSTDEPRACGIYDERPADPCRGYRCLWLLGHGSEDDRPDRSLIIADELHGIEGAIECRQLAPDAYAGERARATVLRMARSADKVALVIDFYAWAKVAHVVGRPL